MASRSLVVNFVGDTKQLEASVKRTNSQLATLKKSGDDVSVSFSKLGSGAGPGILGLSTKTAALAGGVGAVGAALPGVVASFTALAGAGIGIAAVGAGVKVLSAGFQELANSNKAFAAQLAPVKNELQSAFNNAARPLVTELQPVLKALPATIHELAPAFGQVFGAAAGMIQPLAAGLTQLAKSALPALAGIIKAATGLLGPLLNGVGQFIQILGPGITSIVKTVGPLLTPLLKGIGATLQGVVSGIETMLKALGPVIGTLSGVFATIGKSIGGLFAALTPAIKAGTQVFGVLVQVVGSVLTVFGKIAGTLAQALAPAFTTLAHVVTSLLPVIDPVVKIFAQFAGAVLNDLSGVLGAVAKLFQGLTPSFQALGKVAGQVFNTLENSGVFAVIADALERVAPLLAQFVNRLVTGLAPILPVLVSALGALVNSGINTLVASFQILFPIALNLLNQFLTPLLPLIKSMAPVVTTLAQAFGAALVAELQILAPILATLAPEIVAIYAAVKAWTIAQAALDLAMDANPIVALGIAIAAVAGGVIYLATKTNILQDAWAAIKNALGSVVSAISNAWDSVKTKTESVFNSIKSFIKSYWPELLGVFTFGIGTIVGEVIQNWGTIKQKTMDVWNSITAFFQKWWPYLVGTVFGGPIGAAVALVVTHWGTIQDKTTSVFNSIKGFTVGVWNAISNAITSPISDAVGMVKTVVGGLVTWLSNAWGNIKTGVTSFATSIKQGVLTAIQGAINAVIGFLNDIIGVLDKLPFVNIKKITPVSLTGSQGPASTASNAGHGAGYYEGGKVSHPMYMVGEEAPRHPEFVLATNPAYRNRNLGLWQQAGKALNVPGFAQGGVPSGAVASANGPASGTTFVREMGSFLLGHGLTKIAAAGALGNMGRESVWNTGSIGTGGAGAIGWTPPTKIPGWNGVPGGPWDSMTVQENLLWNGSAAAGAGLRNFVPGMNSNSTIPGATEYFEESMENAGIIAMSDRIAYAQQAYDILSGVKGNPNGGGGVLGAIGGVLGSIASTIAGVPVSLLEDGAKALIGELPNPDKLLPSWLQGFGGSLVSDATKFVKDKASSALSSLNPFGGSGSSNAGVNAGSLPQGVSTPAAGWDPLGKPLDNWIIPILDWAASHGWSGHITSGYRSPGEVVSNPQGLVAPQGHSNHNIPNYPGGAIDVGDPADRADGQALWDVIQNYPGKPNLVWGGPTIGDWGHFSWNGHATGGIMNATTLSGAFAQGGIIGALTQATSSSPTKPSLPGKPTAQKPSTVFQVPTLGANGPLPFDVSDMPALNSKLAAIFAVDGGTNGLGIGPDGDVSRLSALISTNTGNWSDDTLFPSPNFGSISDPTQFVIIPNANADGTQPPAFLSSNITTVQGELGQVIGWEQGWVTDLNQTVSLSKQMAAPIEAAIARRKAEIDKIRKRVEANLAKIKSLNKQITDNQTALKNLGSSKPPFANPSNDSQRKRNRDWQQQMSSMKSQISSRITGLQGQVAPLEAENMALTGSKTAGGTTGELGTIKTQLGVPGSSASSLSIAEGGGGTSANGLYGLQQTVAGWPASITSTGGDLAAQKVQLAIYKKQLSNLMPGAKAALVAANSATTSTSSPAPSDTGGGATDTTASGGESLGDQVKDQMIAQLGLRARSAEGLLKASVPLPGFAQGGMPFAGWFGTGGDVTASQPTLIGIGDGPGTETASIRRQGQGAADGITINHNYAPGMEWLADFVTTTVETRERGQVRQARRRLPGGGGGFGR